VWFIICGNINNRNLTLKIWKTQKDKDNDHWLRTCVKSTSLRYHDYLGSIETLINFNKLVLTNILLICLLALI